MIINQLADVGKILIKILKKLGYLRSALVLRANQKQNLIKKNPMKNLSKIALFAFAAASFTFASCESKPAENTTSTEETVEAAEGDSAATEAPAADTTAAPAADTTAAPAQ
jgi:hypothetical protein